MTIGDIFQVAIRASDLDTTVSFYRDALGLVEVSRPAGLAFLWSLDGSAGKRKGRPACVCASCSCRLSRRRRYRK
jgi:catechol 2,3-dioxygenase-like lactoylglutathione lyase family enzyme